MIRKPYLAPSASDIYENSVDTLADHRGRQIIAATVLALCFSGITSPDALADSPANSGDTKVSFTLEPAPLQIPIDGDVSHIILENPSRYYVIDTAEYNGTKTVSVE